MSYQRDIKCVNSSGGNTELYLFPFVKYSRSKIVYSGNYITKFPYSVIYQINSPITSFNESVVHSAGGVEFTQTVSFQLNKILDDDDYSNFAKFDWRIIAKDDNGNYRLIGAHTGLEGKYTKETGGSKPDFNGFKFTFETKEEKTAAFLADLKDFSINENPLWVTNIEDEFVVDLNDNQIEVVI